MKVQTTIVTYVVKITNFGDLKIKIRLPKNAILKIKFKLLKRCYLEDQDHEFFVIDSKNILRLLLSRYRENRRQSLKQERRVYPCTIGCCASRFEFTNVRSCSTQDA